MGKLIILLLMTMSLNAQVFRSGEILSIDGTSYVMKGEMLDLYSTQRSSYSHLNVFTDDLNLYLESFVTDAMVHEAVMDGLEPLDFTSYGAGIGLGFRDINGCSGNCSGASAGSIYPGYNISIRQSTWNGLNKSQRFQTMYHELGHALLQLVHDCDVNNLMFTGASQKCVIENIDVNGVSTPSCISRYIDESTCAGPVNSRFNPNLSPTNRVVQLMNSERRVPKGSGGTLKGGGITIIYD